MIWHCSKNNVQLNNGQVHLKVTKNSSWDFRYSQDAATGEWRKCFWLFEGSTFMRTIDDVPCGDPTYGDGGPGYLYGLYEVDCIIPSNAHYYPTVWLYGPHKELDLFEFSHAKDDKFDFFSNVHWIPDLSNPDARNECPVLYKMGGGLFGTMHTWSVLWTPEKIVYYLDGNEYRTHYIETPVNCWEKMFLVINNGPTNAYGYKNINDFIPNQDLIVDAVRMYEPTGNNYNQLLEEPGMELEALDKNQTDVRGDVVTYDKKAYYRNTSNHISAFDWDYTSEEWGYIEKPYGYDFSFHSDPFFSSTGKLFFRNHDRVVFNMWSDASGWHDSKLDNITSQKALGDIIPWDWGTAPVGEVIYKDDDYKLKHFYWNGSTWVNEVYHNSAPQAYDKFEPVSVGPNTDFVVYEGKQDRILHRRDNRLYAIIKAVSSSTHTPSLMSYVELYPLLRTNGMFEVDDVLNRIYYVTENNNRLRYLEHVGGTWQHFFMNESVTNVCGNVTPYPGANKVFYTDAHNRLWNFWHDGTNWHADALSWGVQEVMDNVLPVQMPGEPLRVFFRTLSLNLLYFEWDDNNGKWQLRVPVNPSDADDLFGGRVKGNISYGFNNAVYFNGMDNKAWHCKEVPVCTELVFPCNVTVYNSYAGKNETIFYTENDSSYIEETIHYTQFTGDTVPPPYIQHILDNPAYLLEEVYPNTSSGVFNVYLKDTTLNDLDVDRRLQITNVTTGEIVEDQYVSKEDDNIYVDMQEQPAGVYHINLIREDGKIETHMIIKE